MDSDCYKSKLRSFSQRPVGRKTSFASKVVKCNRAANISFKTPFGTRRSLKCKRNDPILDAPKARRSMIAVRNVTPVGFDENLPDDNLPDDFDDTPKRKSDRKSQLSEAPPSRIIFHQPRGRHSVQSQTVDFDEHRRIRQLETQNSRLVKENSTLKNLAAQNKQKTQEFIQNIQTLTNTFSLNRI